MGTIVKRARKDGSAAFMAQISIMRDGKIQHRESKTFDRQPVAAAWIKRREAELAKPGALESAKRGTRNPTLGDAIDRYVAESILKIGRTKAQVLSTIKRYDIAAMECDKIESHHIVDFAKELSSIVKPQTAANYLSHLGAVFAIARPAWKIELSETAMADAFKVTKRLGLTAKSRFRERRPSLDELDKLMTLFSDRQRRRPDKTPMAVLTAFAIFSTRRQDEITRLLWADLDEEGSRITVRDMKHPGEKIGNDVVCDLPKPALQIIQAMPRTKPEIFPFDSGNISAAFTRACQFLDISDLHFHDLRHDGVSRLFETGMNIPHAAAVSGHRSWQSLKRYTHIRQTGDKYENWPWLAVVSERKTITKTVD